MGLDHAASSSPYIGLGQTQPHRDDRHNSFQDAANNLSLKTLELQSSKLKSSKLGPTVAAPAAQWMQWDREWLLDRSAVSANSLDDDAIRSCMTCTTLLLERARELCCFRRIRT